MHLLLILFIVDSFLKDTSTGLYNAALYKPAVQCGTEGNYVPSLAVDGNSNGNLFSGHCIHTSYSLMPWWMVHLRGQFVVEAIKLTNRADCCSQRLRNFQIDIFDQDPRLLANFPNVTGNVCYSQVPALGPVTLSTACSSPITGRFVRLVLNVNPPGILNVCEMEVLVSSFLTDQRLFTLLTDQKLSRSVLATLAVSDTSSCVQECLARRSSPFTSFNWVTTSKTCQLFSVNPALDLTSNLTSAPGTNFYIQNNSF